MPKTPSETVHFIGIGGVGISNLAKWFLAQNWAVSGSDATDSEIIRDLIKAGAKVKIGHDKHNISEKTSLVVYTTAIPPTNPELIRAGELNIESLNYAEALSRVMQNYKVISIAGAHGKSTTTAMVAKILIEADFDPTVILGSKVDGNNFREGKSKFMVVESDEYQGSFWNYHPYAALVMNIDLEHLDFYKDLVDIKKSFLRFLNQVDKDGFIVLNKDDKNSVSIKSKIKNKNISWYSFKQSAKVKELKKVLKVPGRHNILNALGAWALAEGLGIKKTTILKGLGKFNGIWRRVEYKGLSRSGFKVYDDYAHHPTEIKASLQALKEKYPKSNLICVFQPHQQKRLEALFEDFVSAFNNANALILLDVYKVEGRDEGGTQNITSEMLASAIASKKNTPEVFYLPPSKDRVKVLDYELQELKNQKIKDNVVVMMGAGDIFTLTKEIMR